MMIYITPKEGSDLPHRHLADVEQSLAMVAKRSGRSALAAVALPTSNRVMRTGYGTCCQESVAIPVPKMLRASGSKRSTSVAS